MRSSRPAASSTASIRRTAEGRTLPADVGAAIAFDQVLLVGDGDEVKIGAPLVSGATVKATVCRTAAARRCKIFKMRRRKHYQKTQGHRQNYTEIHIDDIVQG